MLYVAALLIASVASVPLYRQSETIDRVNERGVQERSYFVIFNEKAPIFEFEANEKVQSWLPSVLPGVPVGNLQRVYNIANNFRGIALWLDDKGLEAALNYEGAAYVEEDQVMRAFAFTDRPDWGQLRVQQATRDLNNTGGYAFPPYGPAGSDWSGTGGWNWSASAWNPYVVAPSSGVKIWIVDTGVLQGHQEFNGRVTTSQDYVNSTGGGVDCNGHGSHCAGSAAGRYRGVATASVIGNVRVLNCQGSGTNANVVAGFNFVTNNQDRQRANILSASLGGGASTTTDDAINNAANNGVIPVVAAGNDNGGNACNVSPARAAGAITVGATQGNDQRATFSNIGTCINVFAPGQSIHSAWYTATNAYNTISGTSMATPLTAGAIALYLQTNQGANRNAVNTQIQNTAYAVVGNAGAGSPNLFINAKWRR